MEIQTIFDECKGITKVYGHEQQSRILQEEAAELIQAVNKYWRATTMDKIAKARDNVIEEMADTLIMITQEVIYQEITTQELIGAINKKLERQKMRMGGLK